MCQRIKETFVINLEKSKHRWASIQSNFKHHFPYAFTRWNAVYGAGLSKDDMQSKVGSFCRTTLCTPGMIGCHLSHQALWHYIWEKYQNDYTKRKANHTWFLIFEDDLKLAPEFCMHVKNIYEDLDSWFRVHDSKRFPHYIHLGCQVGCRLHRISKHLYFSPFLINTTAYMVSLSGVKILLDTIPKKVHYHVDFMLTATNVLTGKLNYYVAPNNAILASPESKTSTVSVSTHYTFPKLLPWLLESTIEKLQTHSHLHVIWDTTLFRIGNIYFNLSFLYLTIILILFAYLKWIWVILCIFLIEFAWFISAKI